MAHSLLLGHRRPIAFSALAEAASPPASRSGVCPQSPSGNVAMGVLRPPYFPAQVASLWPSRTPPPSIFYQGALTNGQNYLGASLATPFGFRFLIGKYSVTLIHFKNEKQGP